MLSFRFLRLFCKSKEIYTSRQIRLERFYLFRVQQFNDLCDNFIIFRFIFVNRTIDLDYRHKLISLDRPKWETKFEEKGKCNILRSARRTLSEKAD